jgi:hypothetical protein
MDSTLTLTACGKTFTQTVSATTTLDDILIYFDVQDQQLSTKKALQREEYIRTNFLSYTGIPKKEEFGPDNGESVITIQYNVPGLMQPKLTFINHPNKSTFQANIDDFSTITIGSIYSNIPTPSNINLTLEHVYTTDHLSKRQQQDAISQVMNSFNQSSQQAQQQREEELRQTGQMTFGPMRPVQTTQSKIDPIVELAEINEMIGAIENRYIFAAPKVIVSVRIEEPQLRVVKPIIAETQKQNDDQNNNNNNDQSSSDVPSDEVSDSDDDEFYKHNKQDYRIIHKMYVKNRQILKAQIKADQAQGKEPLCTVPDSESDNTDDNEEEIVQSQNVNKGVSAGGNRPKSLAEMAKEMRLKKLQNGKEKSDKNESINDNKNEQVPKIAPNSAENLSTTFKNKEGKFCAANLTYRVRIPTVFYELKTKTENIEEEKSEEKKEDQDEQTTSSSASTSASTSTYPKLIINISFQFQFPSTTTILNLYNSLSNLLSTQIVNYITSRMGSSPNTHSTPLQPTTPKQSTQLDTFPFIIALAAPPYTQFLSTNISTDSKKFPFGVDTTMRNLNISNRSAFSFHFRQIFGQTQGNNGKDVINLGEYLHSAHNGNIPLVGKPVLNEENKQKFITKEFLTNLLSPIISQIDDVIVG